MDVAITRSFLMTKTLKKCAIQLRIRILLCHDNVNITLFLIVTKWKPQKVYINFFSPDINQ